MATHRMLEPEVGERSFGSAFDPVLCGVAQGLARLFPPVDGAYQGEAAAERSLQEERPQDIRRVACKTGLAKEKKRA